MKQEGEDFSFLRLLSAELREKVLKSVKSPLEIRMHEGTTLIIHTNNAACVALLLEGTIIKTVDIIYLLSNQLERFLMFTQCAVSQLRLSSCLQTAVVEYVDLITEKLLQQHELLYDKYKSFLLRIVDRYTCFKKKKIG